MASTNISFPEHREHVAGAFGLPANGSDPVLAECGLPSGGSSLDWVGVIGMVVVVAIFILSGYLAVKYLL